METKFKIGDKVVGNNKGRYSITKKGWKGIVINNNELEEKGYIKVDSLDRLESYIVEEKYFDLIEEKKEVIIKDSGKRVKFKSGMERDVEDDKPRYDLIYFPMLKRWAEHMANGAKKYGDRNWEKADGQEELDRFKASAMRHMIQFMMGETDEDHQSAIFFNISGAEYVKDKMKSRKEKNV